MDIEAIARQARETIPGLEGDDERLQQHALRLLSAARSREGWEEDDQAMRERLLARLLELPVPATASVDRNASPRQPVRTVPTDAQIESLVGKAFSAPSDGSRARAAVLAGRAWLNVKQATAGLGFWQRWRSRLRARRLIARRRRELEH
ncbi:hypothetical protein VCB98_05900 [Gammaproteobacteria bacterium AB-CW1]|uniref:Uncharacterized protein n=1 Tax=Natronospira elongata TaxID=3110268 RepID=A0AAP6MMI5_9GAMM|nr:hypothetical protein [Gammaproteobacteria bacterium AB-CW1]